MTFVSQYFAPEETATAEMLSGVAAALATRGFEVRAIAGQPSYHGNAARLPKDASIRAIAVHRVWSTRFDRHRVIGRILNTATFSLSALLAQLRSQKNGVAIVVTNPPTLLWTAAIARILRGRRFIALIHDMFPEVAEAVGAIHGGGVLSRVWRALNRFALRRAETVVVLGQDAADLLTASYRVKSVHVIQNWADADTIKPIAKSENELAKKWDLVEPFVIQYSGNFGRFHEIETIINAAALLDPNRFRFVFIGQGSQKALIEAASGAMKQVRLMPFQPSSLIPLSLTACDVAIVSLKEGLSGISVPSKIYGIMAAGKPVIAVAPADSEAARTVVEAGCGFVTRPGSAQELAAAIRTLESDREECRRKGTVARIFFSDRFTLSHAAGRWERLISTLSTNAPTADRSRGG